ncbi:MAG: tRNA guanosine(34) transglycosylase Tgt [Candidatus Marinimicrobia bacterium]|nr:tRNA guanosine(34) transglycosylase Tgt [Candidatus Neomarinimicrobiota bacterium]
MKFELYRTSSSYSARAGKIVTDHGVVETPIFMPVGTYGTVKALTNEELIQAKAQIILGNTYHLYLRPGMEVIKEAGGLHRFMNWNRPILTDSGGFQIFSQANMRKIEGDEITFRSHIDGSLHTLSPEKSIKIQRVLGSDIIMAFDECTAYPCDYDRAKESLDRTHRWEYLSKKTFDKTKPLWGHAQALFAIIQGSIYEDLRMESIQTLTGLDFDGYAIGGLAVGEPKVKMYDITKKVCDVLPSHKPRYLMGVGKPEDIIHSIARGVDMMDCVLPTRNARNGTLYTWQGKINIKSAKYAMDFTPPDPQCPCIACQNHTKAYLHHLYKNGEITGLRLNTLHNITFFLNLVTSARQAILEDRFSTFYETFCQTYPIEEDHSDMNAKARESRRKSHGQSVSKQDEND